MNDHQNNIVFHNVMDNLQEEREFLPIKNTGATLSLDGNQYCWLLGENLQEGIAGFGDTPYKAMLDFNKVFNEGEIK